MRGVSLVESLVALVVLSVGMLGIAALYVESLRSGRTALLRSQAVILAGDMSDRIRANRGAPASYVKGEDDDGTENVACETDGTGCNPAAMALHDVARWHETLDGRSDAATALPGGRGTIAVDTTTTPATYTISISWLETNQAEPLVYQLRIQA